MLNEELCLLAHDSLYHSRVGTAAPPRRGCTQPSIISSFIPLSNTQKDPYMLELFHSGNDPFSDLDLRFNFINCKSSGSKVKN